MKCKAVSCALLSVALVAGNTFAQDKRASREREVLRRMQAQLHQAQGQLSTLEQEKAKLSQDLETAIAAARTAKDEAAELDRGLKQAQRQRGALTKELDAVKQDLVATGERLAATQKSLGESHGELAHTKRQLQQTEAEKRALEDTKTRNEREIALCEDKNRALYRIGRELMVRYENKGFGDVLSQREPFTGLKQVEIENLLEGYRDKLDEQQIIKPPTR